MKRTTITLLTLLALASISIWAVSAQNPHFLRASFGTVDKTTGCVDVNFKVAGLGNDVTEAGVTLTGTVTAVWACRNRGEQCPNAENKQTTSAQLTITTNFPVNHGQITGSFNICPQEPAEDFCPGNQRLVLDSVSYSNVRLTVEGTGVPGVFVDVPDQPLEEDLFPNCP
jgi:hypothetical protein